MGKNLHISPSFHIAMIILVLFVVYLICTWGKKYKEKESIKTFSKIIGFATLIFWGVYNIYYFWPNNFKWSVSLPLHVCDIIGVVAGVAMIKPLKIYRASLYFFAIALVTQAFITPTGNQDPATVRFWLYWGLHALILSCAIYDISVREYRPKLNDFLISTFAGICYVCIILPINILFDWN